MRVASELVTNTVVHSDCTEEEFLSVRVARDGWLRIAVFDPGASGLRAEVVDRPAGRASCRSRVREGQ
jgi:hypothetical protein